MKKFLSAMLLVGLALGERLWFDLGPNVELVTLVMLLAAAYLGMRWSFGVIVGVVGLSDLILGNTNIFLFTWSAWSIEAIVSGKVFGWWRTRGVRRVLLGSGLGVGSTLFFYLWTNLGVWLLDSWGMYQRDLVGLLNCYIKALPFLKIQLMSTLVFAPLGLGVMEREKLLSDLRKGIKDLFAVMRFSI